MMKRMIGLMMVVLLCFSCSVATFAEEDQVLFYDEVGVVSYEAGTSYTDELNALSALYNVNISIAVVENAGDESVDQYVETFFDRYEMGYGDQQDGVMLLVAMEEREYRIFPNGPIGAAAISADDINAMSDIVGPYLTDGDYIAAFDAFVSECSYQIDGEINGFPFDFWKNLFYSVGVGLVFAWIVTGSMKKKLKSVHKQSAATEYTKRGSMQVTSSNDFFLYRIVDRQTKESNSSSSSRSSGSSRNVGGGKF